MTRDGGLEETRPTGHGRARGLVSSRESGRRVQARTFAPPVDLARVVEGLWTARWDLRDGQPHTTELIGDPAVHIAFEDGESRIVGVWTRLWTRTLAGRGAVRAVKLHPGAGRALLRTSAGDFSNRITPLADHFGGVAALEQAVLGPDDDEAGLLALADWLRMEIRPDPDVELAVRLMRRIRQSRITRVDELADDAGMTVRSLQRLFRSHVGAAPKWAIRRVRLQEAALRVERGDAESLADLAFELGYADQAHLARDFRAATGRTLREFERQ